LGMRKRRPKLNPLGGRSPFIREERAPKRTGTAKSGTALQAANGTPSGPGEVFLVLRTADLTLSRVG